MTRVAILGAGFSGMETALRLAHAGIPCLLLEREATTGGMLRHIPRFAELLQTMTATVMTHAAITLALPVEVIRIRGVAGAFVVTWREGALRREERFTHVVLATGVEEVLPEGDYSGLDLRMVRTQLEMAHHIDGINPDIGRVLFIAGFEKHGPALSVRTAMEHALRLRDRGVSCLVALDTVRMETADMTELYHHCREAGVLFVKTAEPPLLFQGENGIVFQVDDAVLAAGAGAVKLSGTAGLVVVEPAYRARNIDYLFWSPHRPDGDGTGFYGDWNQHLAGGASERLNVYLAGAVTGIESLDRCREDAALIAAAVSQAVPVHALAEVDEEKCAACLTCVRLCPHHAVLMDGHAVITAEACAGCGVCVAECPARALTLRETLAAGDGTTAETGSGSKPSTPGLKKVPEAGRGGIHLFCCEGSTRRALQEAQRLGTITAGPMRVDCLPCTGALDTLAILEAFAAGADGVFVAACPEGNCAHLHGSTRAAARIARCRSMLEELGIQPDRLRLERFSSVMHRRFAESLREFERRLAEMEG
ncbi:hydrogenase iron-sulfur subunit [bacterium]|nr:hydrogenase iron-sulfur subunit [candidate division CSSED10-310 bacterium]